MYAVPHLASHPPGLHGLLRGLGALMVAFALAGCASDGENAKDEPDLRFAGTVAQGETRGERAPQVVGAVEARLLQTFPRARWQPRNSASADVLLDVSVYSARVTESRSSQEQRNCRRWSEPDKDAKGALQRLASRNCIDWQVQQIPCLTQRYEIDVQIRARSTSDDRVIASDRKALASSTRQCGSDASPSPVSLQAQAEREVAGWAMGLLKNPLAALTPARGEAPVARDGIPAAGPAASPAPASAASLDASPGIVAPREEATLMTFGAPGTPANVAASHAPATVEAHALIIGNAAYPGSARLANPLNDARAMSRKLSDLGFKVTQVEDGDRDAMVRELTRFQQRAANSQVTVLYYSGHGMQVDGVNYLIPVNIDLSKPAALKLQALPLDTVIDTYLPGRTRVVFLDACRDNPALATSTRGLSRGLAPMQAPSGTLIAYATRDGGVAEDGTGRHSPFTQALLDLIAEPEDISLVLRKVRDRVMRETAGRQQPWEYGSLSGGALVLSKLRSR